MVALIASQEVRTQRIVDALRQTQSAINGDQASLALKADKVGKTDIEITDFTKGFILPSPDGHRWRIQVTNAGGLTVTSL